MKQLHEIELIVFDMAGTTVDEDNVVYKTVRKCVNDQGYDFTLDTVLKVGAGKEKYQAIQDILSLKVADPQKLKEQSQAAFEMFLAELRQAYLDLNVKTYKGTVELFQFLKKHSIRVVLNTGYNRQTASGLIKKLGWEEGKEFDLLVTADDVSKSRPAPDMIVLAMQKLEVSDPKKVAKVGDSVIDIEEGLAAGCGLTLAVTTGAQKADQLKSANPDYVIDGLPEIRDLVKLE